jgi:hypothetical protein
MAGAAPPEGSVVEAGGSLVVVSGAVVEGSAVTVTVVTLVAVVVTVLVLVTVTVSVLEHPAVITARAATKTSERIMALLFIYALLFRIEILYHLTQKRSIHRIRLKKGHLRGDVPFNANIRYLLPSRMAGEALIISAAFVIGRGFVNANHMAHGAHTCV